MSDEINLLLSRFKEVRIEQDKLRIEEDKIIVTIERLLSVRNVNTDITTTPSNNNTSSRISPTTSPSRSPTSKAYKYVKGDRVRIINYIKMPAGRTLTEADRVGTVTSVSVVVDRVYFKTDSGTKTYRAAKNLILIE